jgi:streptogramin lyase
VEVLEQGLGPAYGPPLVYAAERGGRAWLFEPKVDPESATSTACFADARMELELVVGGTSSDQPWDVASDAMGNIYVAVRGDNRVHKFSADGRPLSSWGPTGGQDSAFAELSAIVIDNEDSSWVLDSGVGQIFHFDLRGELQPMTISELGYAPRGLGLAPNGDLLVAVTGSAEVRRYDAAGRMVASLRANDAQGVEFLEPTSVLITPHDEWVILDAGGHRVWRLGPGGHPIASWNIDAPAPAAASGGLAYHPSGHILATQLADLKHGDLAFFDLDGRVCGRWTIPGVSAPLGIDVDRRGRVLLSFPQSRLVRVYSFGVLREH